MFLKREKSEILADFFFFFWKNIFKTFFLSGVKQNYFFVCLFVFRRKNVWIVCVTCKDKIFTLHVPVRFRRTTICVKKRGKKSRWNLKKNIYYKLKVQKIVHFCCFLVAKTLRFVGLSFKKTFKNNDFSESCLSQCQILLLFFQGHGFNSRVTQSPLKSNNRWMILKCFFGYLDLNVSDVTSSPGWTPSARLYLPRTLKDGPELSRFVPQKYRNVEIFVNF